MDLQTATLIFSAFFFGIIIGMILETAAIIVLIKFFYNFDKNQKAKKNG